MSGSNEPQGVRVYPFLAVMKGEGGNVFHINPDAVSPADVGMLLVDIARHYARAFTQTGQVRTEDQALEEIRRLFDAEWDHPTDPGEGGIRN